MKYFKTCLLLSAVTAMASAPAFAQDANFNASENQYIMKGDTQRFLIKYKDNARDAMERGLARMNADVHKVLDRHNVVSVYLTKEAAARLKGNPNVLLMEPEPRRFLMAEEVPYGIDMVQAPMVSGAAAGSQTVCVMDTGYDISHIDNQALRVTGSDFGAATGDWDFDGHGHGTHVAGTIAAIGGNDEGVVGVIPGDNLNLHIVKVFDNGGGWYGGADLIDALDFCVDAGSNVVSMSLGGGAPSDIEEAAFDAAFAGGAINIAAAGNHGTSDYLYPASYDSVVSIAAVDSSEVKAGFSAFNDQVELAAPGVGVLSTLPGNTYAAWSGTSMATPHVSGVAALVWSHYPGCTAEEIRFALSNSAKDKGDAGYDNSYGYGIAQASDAFDLLADGCDTGTPPPPPPPPAPVEMEKGVPIPDLGGETGNQQFFTLEVPAGASDLIFTLTEGDGTGDGDLYVKYGSAPTTSDYDCRSWNVGNDEECTYANPPAAGTYHVLLNAYSTYTGATLLGDYTGGDAPNEPPVAALDYSCVNLTCTFDASDSYDSDGEIVRYFWKMEPGVPSMRGSVVTHTFTAPGDYRILLSMKDDDGAKSRLRPTVTVQSDVVSRPTGAPN